jgi:hypothetical protein
MLYDMSVEAVSPSPAEAVAQDTAAPATATAQATTASTSRTVRILQRTGLLSLMTLLTVNVYTGSPLMALWIGSRLTAGSQITMPAVGAIGASMLAMSIGLVKLLGIVSGAYDRVTGRVPQTVRHPPWLRSMRGERPHIQKHASDLSPLEVVLVVSVVIVIALFEVWFFFYSGSPIDQRSGRSHDAPLIG